MALWRKNMQIPEEEIDKTNDARTKKVIPRNSFYVTGRGKTRKNYVESPENRRAAGIIMQRN